MCTAGGTKRSSSWIMQCLPSPKMKSVMCCSFDGQILYQKLRKDAYVSRRRPTGLSGSGQGSVVMDFGFLKRQDIS